MKCKKVYNDFVSCCYHEREVELDKLRRDTSKHNEWYWLNIYDKDGEIGLQAEWRPDDNLGAMWKKMAYNMFYGDQLRDGKSKEELDK